MSHVQVICLSAATGHKASSAGLEVTEQSDLIIIEA